MAKAKYPIELINFDRVTVMGVMTIDVSIPKNMEPALDLIGIGKQERENLVGQKLAEIAQLLGHDPDEVV